MFSFLLMIQDWFLTGNLHWFAVFYLFILLRWILVFSHSLRYKPYVCDNKAFFVSVIVPVVDEPLDLFRVVLEEIVKQKPDELIVAVNGPRDPALFAMLEERKAAWKNSEAFSMVPVKILYTPTAGKRNAIRMALENADEKSDIAVLVDSDVIWTEHTLENLLMPFSADDRIGGVTTRQKIYRPNRRFVTMVASALEEIRAEGTMKAMSATEKVGCLPGRTIAFRTEILHKVMPEFLTETFMGLHKEVSDDRSLTNLTLKLGYKTVMQDTAVVYTDAPLSWRKFARQQLRWAEGSQYNNLRMCGWMLRNAKLMFFIYLSDMLMPVLLVSVYADYILCIVLKLLGFYIDTLTYTQPFVVVAVFVLIGAIFGFGLRNVKSFLRMPWYYVLLIPMLTLVLSFFFVPIRLLGLMKCADGLSWGTRTVMNGEEKG